MRSGIKNGNKIQVEGKRLRKIFPWMSRGVGADEGLTPRFSRTVLIVSAHRIGIARAAMVAEHLDELLLSLSFHEYIPIVVADLVVKVAD